MTSQVLEIISFTLQPNMAIEGQSSLAKSSWDKTLSTLAQQIGLRKAYWGRTIESPDEVYLLIDWTSTQHCLNFTQSTSYTTFRTNLDFLLCGVVRFFYAQLSPHDHPQIFQAGVTEIAIFSSFTSSFIDRFTAFSSIIEHAEGCAGVAKSVATNNLVGGGKEKGENEELYIAIIGWPNLETHKKAMETVAFKENVPLIEDCVKEIRVHHVKLDLA